MRIRNEKLAENRIVVIRSNLHDKCDDRCGVQPEKRCRHACVGLVFVGRSTGDHEPHQQESNNETSHEIRDRETDLRRPSLGCERMDSGQNCDAHRNHHEPAEPLRGEPPEYEAAKNVRSASGSFESQWDSAIGDHPERSARLRNWALIATMTVLADINTAPTAGESKIPIGARTPAASGSANTL